MMYCLFTIDHAKDSMLQYNSHLSAETLLFIPKRIYQNVLRYLNPINLCAPLIFAQHECEKINSAQNRPHVLRIWVCENIILDLRVNKSGKENPTETCKVVLVY